MIYGPQASGKTRNRDALARHYGHAITIDGVYRHHRSRKFRSDDGQVHTEIPNDALLLTNMDRRQCVSFLAKHEVTNATIVSITEALAALEEQDA
tara:strand:+ start:8563 stop:8847 length:285 start_codon:yes stop_codon:yes gene_type:complete